MPTNEISDYGLLSIKKVWVWERRMPFPGVSGEGTIRLYRRYSRGTDRLYQKY